jgi:hypothetical protein
MSAEGTAPPAYGTDAPPSLQESAVNSKVRTAASILFILQI